MINYYYCSRSGFYKPQGCSIRQLKSQGTAKINTYCTAHIKTKTNITTGEVYAEVCSTHYGHTSQLEHIRLPKHVKLSIAGQLCQGVSMQHILDDNVSTELKRIHLLSRKDIENS